MKLIAGLISIIVLLIYLAYTYMATNHGLRFRHLSPKLIYITLGYLAVSAILIVLSVVSFFRIDWN